MYIQSSLNSAGCINVIELVDGRNHSRMVKPCYKTDQWHLTDISNEHEEVKKLAAGIWSEEFISEYQRSQDEGSAIQLYPYMGS